MNMWIAEEQALQWYFLITDFAHMIAIYTNTVTNRLSYILRLIFCDILGTEFELTTDKDKFLQHKGPRISYTTERFDDGILICPSGLLFEDKIEQQKLNVTEWEGMKIFYQTSGTADLPFDIFSASFYMVSRYKEYLPCRKDKFKRFEATESLAYEGRFLEEPVINQWSLKLKDILQKKYPDFKFPVQKFQFISTIDVDNAYAFKHKGLLRTTGASLRSLLHGDINDFIVRILTLTGNMEDPYDTYDDIRLLEKKYGFTSLFFFLVGDYNRYDTNISLRKMPFRNLISIIASDHKVGIHPSTASNKNIAILQKEINRLMKVLRNPVTMSRQHFLMLEMPATYQRLIEAGILEDYSMGYASHTGFRAGICTPFRFYHLTEEKETDFVIHPFQVMDVTLQQYLKLNPDEAFEKIKILMDKVKKVKGTFIALWHNESLSDKGVWKGWRNVFEETVRMGTEEVTSDE